MTSFKQKYEKYFHEPRPDIKSIEARKKVGEMRLILTIIMFALAFAPIIAVVYFRLIGEKADSAEILFVVTIFIPVIVWMLYFSKAPFIKYLPCPYCDNSVKLVEAWTCDKCNHVQGKPVSIIYPCEECGRSIEMAFCEHCGEEFRL